MQGDQAPKNRDRVRTAPVLRLDLFEELLQLQRKDGYGRGDPTGATLVKEPDLRVVLMALRAGGRMEEHHASGPLSLQMLEGVLRLSLPDGSVELKSGHLLALEPNVRHDVEAIEDSAFLLTIGRTTYHEIVGAPHESRG